MYCPLTNTQSAIFCISKITFYITFISKVNFFLNPKHSDMSGGGKIDKKRHKKKKTNKSFKTESGSNEM